MSSYHPEKKNEYNLEVLRKDNGFKLTKERSRIYSAQTITEADYDVDIALLANTPAQAKTLLHNVERAATGLGFHVNADKTEYMCFNQRCDITTLNGRSLKLEDKFTYLGSSVSSTEKDISMQLAKAWAAIDRLSVIWKSDLTDRIKRCFSKQRLCQYCCMDANYTYGEIAWRQMQKNATSYIEQVLEAAPNKVAAVRLPTTHHENYPNMQDTAGKIRTNS